MAATADLPDIGPITGGRQRPQGAQPGGQCRPPVICPIAGGRQRPQGAQPGGQCRPPAIGSHYRPLAIEPIAGGCQRPRPLSTSCNWVVCKGIARGLQGQSTGGRQRPQGAQPGGQCRPPAIAPITGSRQQPQGAQPGGQCRPSAIGSHDRPRAIRRIAGGCQRPRPLPTSRNWVLCTGRQQQPLAANADLPQIRQITGGRQWPQGAQPGGQC